MAAQDINPISYMYAPEFTWPNFRAQSYPGRYAGQASEHVFSLTFAQATAMLSRQPVFRAPIDYPEHSLQETVLPKPTVPMESRDPEGVLFASLERLWPGIWHIYAPEGCRKWSRDHHEN